MRCFRSTGINQDASASSGLHEILISRDLRHQSSHQSRSLPLARHWPLQQWHGPAESPQIASRSAWRCRRRIKASKESNDLPGIGLKAKKSKVVLLQSLGSPCTSSIQRRDLYMHNHILQWLLTLMSPAGEMGLAAACSLLWRGSRSCLSTQGHTCYPGSAFSGNACPPSSRGFH